MAGAADPAGEELGATKGGGRSENSEGKGATKDMY